MYWACFVAFQRHECSSVTPPNAEGSCCDRHDIISCLRGFKKKKINVRVWGRYVKIYCHRRMYICTHWETVRMAWCSSGLVRAVKPKLNNNTTFWSFRKWSENLTVKTFWNLSRRVSGVFTFCTCRRTAKLCAWKIIIFLHCHHFVSSSLGQI